MSFEITKLKARWILDSRGRPTVEADMWAGDVMVRAAVPSGASKGEAEALELRDEDPKFFAGAHVTKAVSNINDIIAPELIGMSCNNQKLIDDTLIKLDGTENKSKLGANAILAVSLCAAKLAAKVQKRPLYSYIYEISHGKTRSNYLLPVPASNVLNGGKHAGGKLSIQEFMILPVGASDFPQAIQMIAETYYAMKKIIKKKYGPGSINVGDEGGFAPALDTTREALDIIMESIESAGYSPGLDIVLGMDAAASEFYDKEQTKTYFVDGKNLTADELLDYYVALVEDYPIKSLEDPFDEDAFSDFAKLTKKIGDKVQIVDDDLTVTNVKRLEKAIKVGAGNALLLKVNQIGTLTEAIEAANKSYANDYRVMVSHRSGETCDSTIAHIAVGLCSGFIKTGAPCRSERNSKYNELLRINEELGTNAKYPRSFDDWKLFL